jgi:hypothetical protein
MNGQTGRNKSLIVFKLSVASWNLILSFGFFSGIAERSPRSLLIGTTLFQRFLNVIQNYCSRGYSILSGKGSEGIGNPVAKRFQWLELPIPSEEFVKG